MSETPYPDETLNLAIYRITQLEKELAQARADAEWAEREILEALRIVGPPDGTDDDITRLMKLTAIRRFVEADEEKYEKLLEKYAAIDAAREEGA